MLEIQLLGDFGLIYKGQPVTSVRTERVQSLLAYLLLHRDALQPRRNIAFTLWPDTSEAQARTNLRNLLHALRAALPDADAFLHSDSTTLQWRADAPYQLDVAEFEAALDAATSEAPAVTTATCAALERAAALYGGELLPGNYDDWIMPLRDELQQRYEAALQQLLHLLESSGDVSGAIRHGVRLLRLDPFNEATYVQLMRLHALAGDRSGVQRVYTQCVHMLRHELDVEPSDATQAAYAQSMRMEPTFIATPHASTPRLAPMWTVPPLPVPPTPFVGRAAEVAAISARLSDPDCRLLTLTGLGGIGKTRLALQVAADMQARFAHGVAFVSLLSVTHAADIVPTIAGALDMRLIPAGDPLEQLAGSLRERELLLVLDNAEQLIDQIDVVAQLLTQTHVLKCLVTSRERLYLQGEWVFEVGGLPLPAADEELSDVDMLAGSVATAFFVQCARRTVGTFAPTAEDAPFIRQICHLVDGMPLGIELAAAWVHVLSCREIAQEIERNLDFLSTPIRNVPPRHRTMRAVFDHSWALLSADERRAFRQLSVFRGGFDRTMAEMVTDTPLPLLAALVAKSLLRRQRDDRYDMHERVRQYAYRQLHDASEAEIVLDRHLRAYLALAERCALRLYGAEKAETLLRMEREAPNFHAALEWGMRSEDIVSAPSSGDVPPPMPERLRNALMLAGCLARYWYLSGEVRSGEAWLTEALACSEPWRPAIDAAVSGPVVDEAADMMAIRAPLLLGAGDLSGMLDHYVQAIAFLDESVLLFRMLDDRRGLVMALQRRAEIAIGQGALADAERLLVESLDKAQAAKDDWLAARSLAVLSVLMLERQEHDRGQELAHQSMVRFRRVGDQGAAGYVLNILGQIAIAQGEPARAAALLEEALALGRSEYKPNRDGEAWTLRNLGLAAQSQGHHAQAGAYFRQSLLLRQQLGQPAGLAWTLEGLAEIAAEQRQWLRAATLWGAAEQLRVQVGSVISPSDLERHTGLMAKAMTQGGREAFHAAWSAGNLMTLAQAVQFALQDDAAPIQHVY